MVDDLPPFLAVEQLKTFISEDLIQSTTPIIYRTKTGQRAYGYDATLLPKVCEMYLKARDGESRPIEKGGLSSRPSNPLSQGAS